MVILKIVFTRTLAFFGAAEVIFAVAFLWGFTQMIDSHFSLKKRLLGFLTMVVAVLIALLVAYSGYRMAAKVK